MKKAILFDMDGVLLDTEPVYAEGLQAALNENGISVPLRELYSLAGLEVGEKIEAVAHARGILPDTEKIVREYRAAQQIRLRDFSQLLKPGAKELLQTLRSRGCRLALCSNSTASRIAAVFRDTGLGDFFDIVIQGDQVRRRKPDPEIYRLAIQELSISAESCAAVEDSVFGIRAAKAAGLQTIAVLDSRFPYINGSADRTVRSLRQVADELEALI